MFSDEVDILLPQSGDTVYRWLIDEFEKQKQEIKVQLYERPISKIHLSYDMWTSENGMALLGIVAHYLDGTTWKNQSRLISLKRIRGAHSGENMVSYLLDVVQEYEITDCLGFFTLDNADSNDTYLRTFLPSLTDDELKTRRLRCFGHVLNLSAKVFLFGKNADAFEVEHAVNTTLDRELEEREAWRKYGLIGKLHNICVWVRRSPQRKELFARISNLQEPDFAIF
jgi:hypothetical protein